MSDCGRCRPVIKCSGLRYLAVARCALADFGWGSQDAGMKYAKTVCLAALLITLIAWWWSATGCAATVSWLSREDRDWAYVQRSLGGLSLGEPHRAGQRVTIPLLLHFDRATQIDSALLIAEVRAYQIGEEIHLTLVTALAGGSTTPAPLEADLQGVPPGVYRIFYHDPDGSLHELGTVSL